MTGGTFTPFAGGESLQMHFGAQGGTHFEVAIQLHTSDEQLWVVDIAIVTGANEVASTTVQRQACGAEWLELDIPVFGWGDGPGQVTAEARADGQSAPQVTAEATVELVNPESGI
jgi:hypothetical protein